MGVGSVMFIQEITALVAGFKGISENRRSSAKSMGGVRAVGAVSTLCSLWVRGWLGFVLMLAFMVE